jgi:hypothetical protein
MKMISFFVEFHKYTFLNDDARMRLILDSFSLTPLVSLIKTIIDRMMITL